MGDGRYIMFRLGQKVYIINDTLEMNLPIGSYGYVIAHDRNPDNVFDYVIRIPQVSKQVYVTADDIELEETLIKQAADRIEKNALIDYALATRNKELFYQIMNDDKDEEQASEEPKSQKEFMRQIHLKAWI